MTQYISRVLFFCDDASGTDSLAKYFAGKGFAVARRPYSANLFRNIQDTNPDLILMFTSGNGEDAFDAADTLKDDPETRHIPIVIRAADASAALRRRCFSLGVDDLISGQISDSILFARVRPLVRIATMIGELHYRYDVAREFGVDVDGRFISDPEPRQFKVLALNAQGEDREIIDNALAEGYDIAYFDDCVKAMEALLHARFDALVYCVGEDSEEALHLCSQARSNPQLFNLPVLLIADKEAFENEDIPYEHGASIFLPRPLNPDDLQIGILTLVRRQKTRWDIHEALSALKSEKLFDEDAGIFSERFFHDQLIRRTADAQSWGKHLSIIRLSIENLEFIRNKHGDSVATALFRDVCDWVSSLLRVEDLAAVIGTDEIGIILPDGTLKDAEFVVRRIIGVVINTEFSVKEVETQPFEVSVSPGLATLNPGETANAFFERSKQLS